jgi:hypothetical protein
MRTSETIERVGWVEPFAKPIGFAVVDGYRFAQPILRAALIRATLAASGRKNWRNMLRYSALRALFAEGVR